MNDNSRIVGRKFKKIENINIISDAEYTPCNEEGYILKNCPGWKLKAKTVFHDEKNKTIYYDHAILYILNTPIIYTPHFSHPDPSVNKRTGFLPPIISDDNSLGQVLSLPYFVNIAGNQDLTLTPTFQTTENNYLTGEYRLLNSKGLFGVVANINDNNDKEGSKHYLFLSGDLDSQLSDFNIFAQTTNNDTYMRKNQINYLNVLTSGFYIEDKIQDNFFSIEAKSFKHLNQSESNQWEYIYPAVQYNLDNLDDPFFDGNLILKNNFLYRKSLDKNKITNLSTEAVWSKDIIEKKNGLVFSNFIDSRILYSSIDYDDINNDKSEQIRIFPQISSKISWPLFNYTKNYSQTISPIIMPILAPYNNYTSHKSVNSGNIFSRNRASSLSEWESGPRINYGIEWYVAYKKLYDAKFTLGQSLRKNKENVDNEDEFSDISLSSNIDISDLGFITSNFEIDKEDYFIKNNSSIISLDLKNTKVVAEYDFTSDKSGAASEQIGFGTRFQIAKNFDFKYSGKRNLHTDEYIGYETGLFYENDCLALQFRYYRDKTKYKDVEDSEGISFLITLKPFGGTKTYGKSKIFGPNV